MLVVGNWTADHVFIGRAAKSAGMANPAVDRGHDLAAKAIRRADAHTPGKDDEPATPQSHGWESNLKELFNI